MSLTPMGLLQPFAPVNPTTPFTYRDNQTFFTILSNLQDKVNELVAFVNTSNANNTSDLNSAVSDLTNTFNLKLQDIYNLLVTLVEGSHDESVADDPTTGLRLQGLSTVVGNVYDNARIFAYFAKQYDDHGFTAAEYDALNYSARHFDLAPLYPTLSDTLTGN